MKNKFCPGHKTSLLMTVAGVRRFVRQTSRVLRGGSFNNNDRDNLLSSYRNNDEPTDRNDNNGFRVVLVVSGG